MNRLSINKVLWLLCLLAGALPLWAQQPGAKEILDRTAEAFKKAGGVRMAFTVRATEGTTVGTIRLKGDKFLLETGEVTTWFDGRMQWSYLACSDEVNLSEPTAEELQSINPYALLSIYKQGYSLKLEKAEDTLAASHHKVLLTATDRKRELQLIILYVEKGTYRPTRICTTQRGGATAVITIDSYRAGEKYPDSLFVFDKKSHPTAEVIDLR